MCGCLFLFAKIWIGLISLIFSILGVSLLVFGTLVKVQIDSVQQLFDPIIQMAKSQAQSAVGDNIEIPSDNIAALIEDLVGGLAMAFIILGIVMLAIGVMGVAGACCMVRCMMILYIAFLVLIKIGLVIVIMILANNKSIVTEPPKAELTQTLQAEYRGLNGTDVTSLLWNTIMSWQQCCGINNYKDFAEAKKWERKFGPGTFFDFEIPAACCKAGEFTGTRECTLVASDKNNKDVGCYDKLFNLLLDGGLFITFAVGSSLGMDLQIFLAAVILNKINKKNKVGA